MPGARALLRRDRGTTAINRSAPRVEQTAARLDTRRDHDMRRMFFATVLTVLVGAGSAAAQSTIAFGPHDFSGGSAIRHTHANIKGQTCVFCHTPHEGAAAGPPWDPQPTTSPP